MPRNAWLRVTVRSMSDRDHLLDFCDAQIERLEQRLGRLEGLLDASGVDAASVGSRGVVTLREELGWLRDQRAAIAGADAGELTRLRQTFESALEVLRNDVERALARMSNPDAPPHD